MIEISECCAAPIIFSDICSYCKEHTGIITLCEECEEEESGYGVHGELCKDCDEEQERDHYADSE